MKHWNRYRARVCAMAAAMLLPAWATAQQTAPPLPERVRTLDESVMQEQGELLQRVAPAARDQGRLVAALKAQQVAWLQYRDATCDLAGTLGGGSSAASTRTLQCKADWAEVQRTRLWAALDCIGKGAPADLAAELDRCLPALVAASRP